MKYDDLWRGQQEAILVIDRFLTDTTNKSLQFTVGMRGGKTTLFEFLRSHIKLPSWYVSMNFNKVSYSGYDHLIENLDRLPKRMVIVLDDFWWESRSKSVLDSLNINQLPIKLIGLSSRSDNTDSYKFDLNHYFASWDWNPNISPEALTEYYINDRSRTIRDFGLEDSKSIPKIEWESRIQGKVHA